MSALRPHDHVYEDSNSRKNHNGLFRLVKDVLARLNVLDNHEIRRHKGPHIIKKSWVRKSDHIHPLRDDNGGLTLTKDIGSHP